MKVEFTEEEREKLKELLKCKPFGHPFYEVVIQDFQDSEPTEEDLREQFLDELESMFEEETVIHQVKFKGNTPKMLDDMSKKFKSRDIARSILEEYLHFNYTDIINIAYDKELDTTIIQYYEF